MYVNKKKIQLSTRFKLTIYTHYYKNLSWSVIAVAFQSVFYFEIHQNDIFFIF